MSERKFEFTLPTRIIFQPGCIRQVGVEALPYRPRRALLVTDPGVLAAGIAQKAADSLQSVGIPYQIFSDLSPNPRDYELDAGGRLAREAGIDLIVAVGGGSALDAAKAIGVLLTHPGCILDWCGSGGLDRPIVPLIAVPTTAGTGSEVTPFSVVTNSQTHIKQCVWDLRVAARVALLDSELLSGLPAPVMAATGIDALTHAVEAYTCTQATPFTDPLALRAITLVSQNLRQAVDTHAPEACAHMLLASNLAGIAFAFSDVAAVHTMAEALGGRYDLPHGQANAMLLCTVSRHNIPFAAGRYAEVAAALGVPHTPDAQQMALQGVEAMRRLCRDVGIGPLRAAACVNPADFPALARAAMTNDATYSNPAPITEQTYCTLFQEAYEEKGC